MTMSVIDLGDVSDPPPGRPGDGGPRMAEFRRGAVRRLLLAATAVVCVVGLGASARPGPPLVRELWSVPFTDNDQVVLHGDTAYLFRATGEYTLSAADVATGEVRWSRTTEDPVIALNAVSEAGVILAPADAETVRVEHPDGSQSFQTVGGRVTAIDAASGRDLWEQPGNYEYAAHRDSILLTDRDRQGLLTKARLVHPRTGALIWERPLAGGAELTVQYDHGVPVRLVVVSKVGEVTVLDYGTGVPRITGRLPWTSGSVEDGRGGFISAMPGLLLLHTSTEDIESVAVHRLDTLERLWQRGGAEHLAALDCGPMICVATVSGSFEAVDRETGTVRWTAVGYPNAFVDSGPGVILVTDPGAGVHPRTTLLEAATGRRLGSSASGWPAVWAEDAGFVLFSNTMSSDLTRSALTRLDLRTGRVTVLGSLPLVGAGRCDGEGRHLACHSSGRMRITAIG